MCFGGREKDSGGNTRSRELDRIIRQDEKRLSREVKLLLLGKWLTFRTHLTAARAKSGNVPTLPASRSGHLSTLAVLCNPSNPFSVVCLLTA